MPPKETIEKNINDACVELYAQQKDLIDERANELNIVGHLAPRLRLKFPEWDIDTDYNREGPLGNRITKTDVEGSALKPDIIFHQRGEDGVNLVAIQVKGYWNKDSREKDEDSLRRLREKHEYVFLYRLELGRDGHQLIGVV